MASTPSFPGGSSPLSTSTPNSPRFRTSFASGVPVGGGNGGASPYISPYLARHQNISRHQQQRPLSSSSILSLSNTFPISPLVSHSPGAWNASDVSGALGVSDASGVPFDIEDIDMSDSEREQGQGQEEDGGDDVEEEEDGEEESIDSDDSDISSDEADKDKSHVRDREREAAPTTAPSTATAVPAPMPVVIPISPPSSTAVPSPRMTTSRLGLFGVESIFKGISRRSEDSVSVASASSTDSSRRNSHQSVPLPPTHHPTHLINQHIQYDHNTNGLVQETSIPAAADGSDTQRIDIPKTAVSIAEVGPPPERIPTPSLLASPPPPEPAPEPEPVPVSTPQPAPVLAPISTPASIPVSPPAPSPQILAPVSTPASAPASAPPPSSPLSPPILAPEEQEQVLDLHPTESSFHCHLMEPHPYSESILSDASESTLTDDAFLPPLTPSPTPLLSPVFESAPAPAPASAPAPTPATVVTATPEPDLAPAPMMIAVQQQHAPQTYELASRITASLQNSLAAASTRVISFSMLASDNQNNNSNSDSASMATPRHQQLQLHPTKTLVTTDTTTATTSTSVANNASSPPSSSSSPSFTSELNLLQTSVSSLHQRLDRIEQSLVLNSNRNRSVTTRGMTGTVLGVIKMVVKQGVIHAVLIVVILLVLYKRKSPIAMVILAYARGQLGVGDRTGAGLLDAATVAASASASGMATNRGRGGSWWYVMRQLL